MLKRFVTKDHLFCDFLYMKYPEQADPQRKWLLRARQQARCMQGGNEWQVTANGYRVSFWGAGCKIGNYTKTIQSYNLGWWVVFHLNYISLKLLKQNKNHRNAKVLSVVRENYTGSCVLPSKYQFQKERSSVLSCYTLPTSHFPDLTYCSHVPKIFFLCKLKVWLPPTQNFFCVPKFIIPPVAQAKKPQGYLWPPHCCLINHQKPLNSQSKVSHELVCSLPPAWAPPQAKALLSLI